MSNRNYLWLIGVIVLFISGCTTGGEEDYTIVDNSVLIDNDDLYLKVTPHTLVSSGWVETEFQSKAYSGEIDFAFGFDTDVARPTEAYLYNPKTLNTTRVYDCQYDFTYTVNPNYFWCYTGDNSTGNVTIFEHWFDNGSIVDSVAQWHENYSQEWQPWKPDNSINYDYAGMNKWYYSTNQYVNANQTYRLRYYLDVPFDPIRGTEGKYTLALKPSSKSFAQAIADEQFYYLDPWWNQSYLYRYNMTINISGELASYTDVVLEFSIANFNGSWDSLEVAEDKGGSFKTYDWEWAVHDQTDSQGNATKAIRFIASNVTFDNATLNSNFSIYLPETTTSPTNDSIFLIAEDWNDGDADGWNKDADFGINFQDDGWVNLTSTTADGANTNFTIETLNNVPVYIGWKSRLDPTQFDEAFYISYGESVDNSVYTGMSNADHYRLFDGAFKGILTDVADINVTHILNASTSTGSMIYNWTARPYGLLSNNTRLDTSDRGNSNTFTHVSMLIGGNDPVMGAYIDDIYVSRIPFQLYYANISINLTVGEEQTTTAPTINSIGFGPSPANATYTGPFNCSAEAIYSQDLDTYNATFTWYKNATLMSDYTLTTNDINLSSTIILNATNFTGTIEDDATLYCNLNLVSYRGDSGNNTLSSSTLTITGSAPGTPSTVTPATGIFADVEVGQTLTCSGATDVDSDTVFYQFWNSTSLLQNTTATTYTHGFGNAAGNEIYNWSCRANDDDGSSDWAAINRTITPVKFAKTNETYFAQYINFTFADEISGEAINGEVVSFAGAYTIGSNNFSMSYSNSTEAAFADFSFEPHNETIKLTPTISFKSTGYPQRTFSTTYVALTNTTTQQLLYLINSTDGSYSSFHVTTALGDPIPGVEITVAKLINGTYTNILGQTADGSGTATFFLDSDTSHQFTFVKTGYATVTQTITPTASDYYITMGTSTLNVTYNSSLAGLKWVVSPPSGFINASTGYNFTFNITANLSNLVGCKMELHYGNGTNIASSSGCSNNGGNGDNLTVNFTTHPTDSFFGNLSIQLDSTGNPYYVIDGDWKWAPTSYNASGNTLRDFFRNLGKTGQLGDNDVSQTLSSIWLFFIAVTILLGVISVNTGVEFSNPGVMNIILFLLVVAASSMDWFSGWSAGTYVWWDKWWLATLSGAITAAYFLNQQANRRGG